MKRFFIRIYDALSHKIRTRRRKEYVRRMEHIFDANIGTCFVRVNGSPTELYIKCDDFIIYRITGVSDMYSGTLSIDDVYKFIDLLHERWMSQKQYTQEDVCNFCQ